MNTQRKKWPWERNGVPAGTACPRVRPPQTPNKQRRLPVSSWPPREFGLVAPRPRGGGRGCESPSAGAVWPEPWGLSQLGGLATVGPAGRGSRGSAGLLCSQGCRTAPWREAGWTPGPGLSFPFLRLPRSPWNRRTAPLPMRPGTPLPEAGRLTLTALSSACPGEMGRGLLPAPPPTPTLPSPPTFPL